MKTATLVKVSREGSDSFRVMENGKLVFATRSYPTEEGHAGARIRLAAWALRTGYRITSTSGRVVVETPQPVARVAGSRYGRH